MKKPIYIIASAVVMTALLAGCTPTDEPKGDGGKNSSSAPSETGVPSDEMTAVPGNEKPPADMEETGGNSIDPVKTTESNRVVISREDATGGIEIFNPSQPNGTFKEVGVGLPAGFPAGIPVLQSSWIKDSVKASGANYSVKFSATSSDIGALRSEFPKAGFDDAAVASTPGQEQVTYENGAYSVTLTNATVSDPRVDASVLYEITKK